MKKYWLVFVFAILQFPLIGQTDNLIILENPHEFISVGRQVLFLEDETNMITIEDILQPEYQSRFKANDKDVFYRQPSSKTFWLRLEVENRTQESACIELAMANIFYLDYYQNINNQYRLTVQTGSMRPEISKAYPVNLFWLPISTNQKKQTVYIKFSGEFITSIPIHIGTFEALSYHKVKSDYFFGGFMGIMIVMFFYNFFLLLITKDKIYGWYIAYLIATIIHVSFLNNYPIITYLFEDLKPFLYQCYVTWGFISILIPSLFLLQFLDLFNKHLLLARLFLVINIPAALLIPVFNITGIIPQHELLIYYQSNIMILSISSMGISVYLWLFKKDRNARFFTLGWFWVILSAIILLLVVNGFLPSNFYSRNAMLIGYSLESMLFSLALGDRINTMRKEMQKTQVENFKLIQNQNQKLEQKVKIRTEELQIMNEDLMQSNEKIMESSKELEKLNATKDKLFAIIGHDLRSPINSLKGLMSLVTDYNMSADEFREISNKLKNGVEYVHFTLNNLLFWANSQMHGIQTNPKQISLYEIAKENCDLFQEIALGKKINLSNEINENTMVWADSDQVNLIFRNLISNAIKFTGQGGEIRLKAEAQNGFHQIVITDTGVGIQKDIATKLFNIALQVNTFGTDNEKGTGLGLILCKDFIEKNGGKIWVESTEGVGSRFYFTLPTTT